MLGLMMLCETDMVAYNAALYVVGRCVWVHMHDVRWRKLHVF